MPPRPRAAPKSAVSWAVRVEGAASAHEVVDVARDFLAQLTPYEVHELPAGCEPPAKIVDADDVTAYALVLVREDCEDDAAHVGLAHKMADFFSHASRRLVQLAGGRDTSRDS